MPDYIQLHAACISIDGKGVLLLGASGSGKSNLALRLIDGGAMLVADDRVDIHVEIPPPTGGRSGGGHESPRTISPHPNPPPAGEGTLLASAPANLRGMLEVRGVGIMRLSYVEQVPLALGVELVGRGEVERLPEPKVWHCLGVQLPLLSLHAFDDSTCAKIRVYLKSLCSP